MRYPELLSPAATHACSRLNATAAAEHQSTFCKHCTQKERVDMLLDPATVKKQIVG